MTARNPLAEQTLVSDQLVYAESPRWHQGRLYVSDVHDYRIKSIELSGEVTTIAKAPGRPAGIGFLPSGDLLVATALDHRISILADGALEPLADLSAITTGLLNDMVVGKTGRAYVGATGFNLMAGESPCPGQLVMIEPGHDPLVVSHHHPRCWHPLTWDSPEPAGPR
jgi:sugar lactone lactonase YvrE